MLDVMLWTGVSVFIVIAFFVILIVFIGGAVIIAVAWDLSHLRHDREYLSQANERRRDAGDTGAPGAGEARPRRRAF